MINDDFYNWIIDERGLSENTAKQYTSLIDRFSLSRKSGESITEETVKSFVGQFDTSPSNHNRVSAALGAYKMFLEGKGEEFPFTYVKKKQPKRLPVPMSKEEIDRLVSVIPDTDRGIQDRAMIELMYCGLRSFEVCNIREKHINNDSVRVVGKGNKERIVPLNDTAKHFISEHLRNRGSFPEELLFTAPEGKIYPRYLRHMITRYGKMSGVKNARCHRLRHSFATHVLDSGLQNLFALKDAMGHSSLNSTQIYVLVSEESRKQINQFHPRSRNM